MFEDRELAGFSGEERAVARAELQKSIESLDIFERKLMIAWADERLSNVASMLIKRDRKSTRLNSSHLRLSRMPSSA